LSKVHQPFFILGNPRSGTSLLRIILNAHPNLVVPPESGFLQWWSDKYQDWQQQDNLERIDSFLSDLLSSKKIEGYNLNRDQLRTYILEASPSTYGELVACIYIFYAGEKELLTWGDKNNYYIHHIPLIRSIFPKANFIHMVRDGRDVACSYLELERSLDKEALYRPNLPVNVELIADEWINNNLKIEKELNGANYLRVRFEDVIRNFDKEIGKILSFINVPWSDEIKNYWIKNDEPEMTLSWKKKTKLPLQKEAIERYKKELAQTEINTFNTKANSVLNRYGYEL
jgi:hypothetical protein